MNLVDKLFQTEKSNLMISIFGLKGTEYKIIPESKLNEYKDQYGRYNVSVLASDVKRVELKEI